MKTFIALVLSLGACSALTLQNKNGLNFDLKGLQNCGKMFSSILSIQQHFLPTFWNWILNSAILEGYENAQLQFLGGTVNESIQIPGNAMMTMQTRITADLPSDLKVKLKLKKLEPFPLNVPCIDGLGSW